MTSGADSPKVTIGRLLQEARLAKGLTSEAAADGSKVSLLFIRLMEEEQFHTVPDPLYILRFLRDYSVFLGLNPTQVETQFRNQVMPARAMAPLQAPASLRSRIRLRSLLPYALPAVALIPLIFIMLSLFSGRRPEVPSARQPQSPPAQEVAPALPQSGQVASPTPQAASPGGELPTRLKATQPAAPVGVPRPQARPPRYTLRAEAKQISWLAVSADGAARREVTLRAGQSAQWSANEGFVVTIGNSEAIALSLNGKLVTLKGGWGPVVRDLILPGNDEPMKTR